MVLMQHASSFASYRPRPNAARVFGIAGAIALNIALLMALLMPMQSPMPGTPIEDVPFRFVLPDVAKKPPPLPPVEIKQKTRPQEDVRTPTATPPVKVPVATDPVVDPVGTLPVEITHEPSFAESAVEPALHAGPLEGANLGLAESPRPVYPREALRAGIHGTVMLQVLVDVDGRPLQVTIHQSSGNRDLDDAARKQVLKRWRFHPAIRQGVAVQAAGLVAVAFEINR